MLDVVKKDFIRQSRVLKVKTNHLQELSLVQLGHFCSIVKHTLNCFHIFEHDVYLFWAQHRLGVPFLLKFSFEVLLEQMLELFARSIHAVFHFEPGFTVYFV